LLALSAMPLPTLVVPFIRSVTILTKDHREPKKFHLLYITIDQTNECLTDE
jgi:hypothetical protein